MSTDLPATLPRYALVQRMLHWLIAVLVILALIAGGTIGFLGFEGMRATFGAQGTDFFYTAHKTLGLSILGLMVLRLIARLWFDKPPYAVPLSLFQRLASRTVHTLFYVLLLLVMPVLGVLATASGGFPVHFFHIELLPGFISENEALSERLFGWHRIVGITLAGLIVLHVAGAIYHWKIRRDGVMERMSLLRQRQ
ncbi:Cytochrome B561 [Thioalkalivibrio nitratireducens DSM 14787]|uniref:Cytochrome B561 n=1 Tax=Thioalkalivibrio nitratireducens (strain DSM 14787 / UNIQEM 213 / ALEN2) TaxID=1255043 RepID=L0DTN7_THIND|nr:Cytochrome B561 [Thioalkalivibrio nitratireducens DSM 14787]